MKKALITLGLVTTLVVGLAGTALAHHVGSINVQVGCNGYSGSAVLNVFDNHSYRVTAPGFDTGIITEPGSNHNVTVSFGGSATSGTITATIWNGRNGSGGVEDQETKQFSLDADCGRPVDVFVKTRMPKSRFTAQTLYNCAGGNTADELVTVTVNRFKGARYSRSVLRFSCPTVGGGTNTVRFNVTQINGRTLVLGYVENVSGAKDWHLLSASTGKG